jgi:hypothetical protein
MKTSQYSQESSGIGQFSPKISQKMTESMSFLGEFDIFIK